MPRWTAAACLALTLAAPAAAQPERYELGRRLKQFEGAWADVADPAARARALEILPQATTQFLSLRPGEAARTLDLATHALRSVDPPTPAWEWANSLVVVPQTRLLDGGATELGVTIKALYPVKGPAPGGVTVTLRYRTADPVTVRPDRFPATVTVPVRPAPAAGPGGGADLPVLTAEVAAGGVARRAAVRVDQVRDLAARLAALRKKADGWAALDTIERATVRDRLELLAELAAGSAPETDLPAADLLAEAERMADGAAAFAADKPGRFWLSVPLGGKGTAPVRVFVPAGLDPARPAPVVVALHGAGGSENLFFEGYGAGRAVAECEKRGWVLVATRGGFLSAPPAAAVVEGLAKRLPLDPKRAFLVGHSMGAAQAVDLVQRHPGRFAAAAALGGGGRVRDPRAFASTPVFVGVGERDFARGGARALHAALTAGGAAATLREYPALEHLSIVREALPDAFALFDRVAR